MARWPLVALLALAACDAGDAGVDPLEDPRFRELAAAREGHLLALAAPVRDCVARVDNVGHPAFHGCYDWHSAVHGTWALLAVARLTGDEASAAAAEAVLEPALVAEELARLQAAGVAGEIPYGYAWFLRLAGERAAQGRDDLAPLAAEVAADLEAYLVTLPDARIRADTLSPEYANLSWAVLNLWQHAVRTGDEARRAASEDLARRALLPWDADCPLDAETGFVTGFFPPCLHRALALAEILPAEERRAWLEAFLPGPPSLLPLTEPSTAHSAGLDFSRAWGLWALYRATSDVAYLHLYLDHVEAWLARPAYWAENYDYYSHWVPQFGIYALALGYE